MASACTRARNLVLKCEAPAAWCMVATRGETTTAGATAWSIASTECVTPSATSSTRRITSTGDITPATTSTARRITSTGNITPATTSTPRPRPLASRVTAGMAARWSSTATVQVTRAADVAPASTQWHIPTAWCIASIAVGRRSADARGIIILLV